MVDATGSGNYNVDSRYSLPVRRYAFFKKESAMRPFRTPLLHMLVAVCGQSCVVLLLSSGASAQTQFQSLLDRVPHSANAVTILNVEKAKQSPTGLKEGLAEKLDKAFRDGLIRVPPSAARFVLAAEVDLEFMSPIWEAAV